MLYEKIVNDMKSAMKNREKSTLSTIRFLKNAIDMEAKDKKKEITDELVIDIAARQIKTHKASIEEFDKANRTDLSDKLKEEIKLIEKYLPTQLTEEEINNEIEKVFEKVKPTSKKDMGLIMKELSPLKGKADFKIISTKVNKLWKKL